MLKCIDIYGKSIFFNIQKKQKHKTNTGGIITLITILLFIMSVYEFGKEIIIKQNPTINYSQISVKNPEPFTFNKNNFPLVMSIMQKDGFKVFKDDTVFQVNVQQRTQKRIYNEDQQLYETVFTYNQLQVEHCQKEKHFNITELEDFYNQYDSTSENQYMCINTEQNNVQVQGDFSQDTYQSIIVDFIKCQNTTENQNCKPQEQIDILLKSLYFDFFYPDTLIDQQNVVKPFSQIGTNFFTMISGQNPKQSTLFLEYVNISSDTGYFLQNIKEEKTIKFKEFKEFITFENSDTQLFFQMELRLYPYVQHQYSRIYKKVPILLAELGGILKALLFIGFCITYPIADTSLKQLLTKQLYVTSEIQQQKNLLYQDKLNKFKHDPEIANKIDDKYNLQKQFEKLQQNTILNSSHNQNFLNNNENDNSKNINLQQDLSQNILKNEFQKKSLFDNNKSKQKSESSNLQLNTFNNQIKNTESIYNNGIKQQESNKEIQKDEQKLKKQDIKIKISIANANYSQKQQVQQNNFFNNTQNINNNKQIYQSSYNLQFNQNFKDQVLKLTFFDYFKYYCPKKLQKNTEKQKSINYACDLIQKNLDIVHILAKLQQFNNIKSILLDEQTQIQQEISKQDIQNNQQFNDQNLDMYQSQITESEMVQPKYLIQKQRQQQEQKQYDNYKINSHITDNSQNNQKSVIFQKLGLNQFGNSNQNNNKALFNKQDQNLQRQFPDSQLLDQNGQPVKGSILKNKLSKSSYQDIYYMDQYDLDSQQYQEQLKKSQMQKNEIYNQKNLEQSNICLNKVNNFQNDITINTENNEVINTLEFSQNFLNNNNTNNEDITMENNKQLPIQFTTNENDSNLKKKY